MKLDKCEQDRYRWLGKTLGQMTGQQFNEAHQRMLGQPLPTFPEHPGSAYHAMCSLAQEILDRDKGAPT